MSILNFDTNNLFSGGAGIFVQYHDVIKPAYLYAIFKLMLDDNKFGLPLYLLNNMSVPSLIEWYVNRRYINPLKQLDYDNLIDENELDIFLYDYMKNDSSIYQMAPMLNFYRMINVYRSQYMSFPIYVYSEMEEPGIQSDIDIGFAGTNHQYLHGSLKDCIAKCDENFTYIFSDVEGFKIACDLLDGRYAHLLLARDYRYNYIDGHKTFAYDLRNLMFEHPPIRTGTISVFDSLDMHKTFENIIQGGT